MKDARTKKPARRFYIVKTSTGEQIAIIEPTPEKPASSFVADLDRVDPPNAPHSATYIP